MSHAYARNFIHLTFSTKDRRKKIRAEIEAQFYLYVTSICEAYKVQVLEIGGTEDHLHLLLSMPPRISVSTIVAAIKANSSKWMNETGHLFAWQQGYGAFSVSASNLESVRSYIRKQKQHHAKRSFEEEFKAMLRKHGIEFTPERVLG